MPNGNEQHVVVALVEDKPGVLQRISGLFRKRNFNIDSITVGHSEKQGVSRMTIAVKGDERTLEQVMKQLNKLIDVVKVTDVAKGDAVMRELALVKIATKNETARAEIVQFVNIFRGRIVDVGKDSLIVEITGDSQKIDAFVNLVSSYGIKELGRTGITAMTRGGKPAE